ncbi:MAG: aminotransferase class III-fold pyridoxal phosphate-dependent enzyme [Proteobacteria bacterium]|nr:aminotransferase class III-fold pyridoxal phosphate-dependent enzyme [Pseudomonadota bacterium]
MNTPSLLERRYRVMGRHSPLFYDRPLHLVRGEGVWVFDADGRRYLDAYNNVPHVGHCHPYVVAALSRQAAILNTHTRYLDEGIVAYAERLLGTFDASLSNIVFVCTGSEANELALRIARETTGHQGIISTAFAYHGNTVAVSQISSLFTPPEQRGPYVRTIPVIDPYRERRGRSDAELVHAYAADVQQAIEDFHAKGVKLAGILLCTALSSEGLPNVPPGYLQRVADLVHAAGGLVIADEVQGGFGRFGTHMWGHAALGAVPDIVTMGKPMGNGHPLAGVVTRPDLIEAFESRNMYFNTFGGNPVSAATGMAVLEVLEREQLLANARTTGAYVIERLNRLRDKHQLIGDVRGKGMFFAVELVTDRKAQTPAPAQTKRLINAMRDRGVLISRIGVHDNILKIRPPMPFKPEHADLLVDTLDDVLKGL